MYKNVEFKNRDRFIQIGIAISTIRRVQGMSQEQLAEKANISRVMLSNIEAPNRVHNFSLQVLFNISDALNVLPQELISMSVFPEDIIKNNQLKESDKK